MKKLFLKSFLLLIPFLVINVYFFIEDPMKIIHDTDNPVSRGVLMNDRVYVARHLINSKTKYNAFILGSSRSKAFKTANWKKNLKGKITPYHMGVNDETLFGLERKLNFLDSTGYSIDHVLLPIDHRLLSLQRDHEAHIFREYYALTDETASSFYRRFFMAFLKPKFLKEYIGYQQDGVIDASKTYLWDPGFDFNVNTGDIFYSRMDEAIAKDSTEFYTTNKHEFHPRELTQADQLIDERGQYLLKNIKRILKKHKTKFKVIITPNYDLVALHPADVAYLKKLFGYSNVINYSGDNEITKDHGNYYEHKHFKPYIANRLMKIAYHVK